MPKTCPSSLDNDDDDVDGDVDDDNDVFAALTMFVDIEERRRRARVSPMFPAGSFFGNISTKIFPTDFFTRNISTKILLHTLTVSLFLQEYFFSPRIFFTRNFYRQGIFLPGIVFFLPKSSPSGFFLQWSVASRKCHWTSLALWLFAAMAENISLLITKKGKMTALQFGRAVNCKQFQFWCSRLAGRQELV